MVNHERNIPAETDPTDLTSRAGSFAVGESVTIDTGDRYQMPDIPEGIMSGAEINEWASEHNYDNGRRGTYGNGESFFYKKDCHRVSSEEDVAPALEAARYLTDKGMIHPDTKWGAFKYDNDDGYQLFAVSPKLQAWSTSQIMTPQSDRLSKSYNDKDSAKLEWLHRLDPTATVGKAELREPAAKATIEEDDFDFADDFFDYGYSISSIPDEVKSSEPLAGLLNIHEASHLDNWGWDTAGNIYPIDVEVIRLASNMPIVRDWYAQQHPDQAHE